MTDELLALVGADVRDAVARCAAAAGYRIVVAEPEDCRRLWLRAAAVVVDVDAVHRLSAVESPRRGGVLLVDSGEPPSDVWRPALALGADDVVSLPADESRLVTLLGALRVPGSGPGRAVALIGGHGGAGASTLAAAVALRAGGRGSVLLLDVDEMGAGLDLLLGIEHRSGLRWQDLSLTSGAVRAQALRDALPHADEKVAVLAPRRDAENGVGADAVRAVLDATRADGEVVVVDSARSDGPIVRAVCESVDLIVVVTGATVHAVAASRAVAGGVCRYGAAVELVVRGPAPGGLRPRQVADAVDLPLLTAYRADPGLAARLESGRLRVGPRQPLGRAADAILARLDEADRTIAHRIAS